MLWIFDDVISGHVTVVEPCFFPVLILVQGRDYTLLPHETVSEFKMLEFTFHKCPDIHLYYNCRVTISFRPEVSV